MTGIRLRRKIRWNKKESIVTFANSSCFKMKRIPCWLYFFLITARKRSLRRLCFSRVCLSTVGRGSTWAGTHQSRYTPWTRYTPQDQIHPPDQVHPQSRYTPWSRYTPCIRYTPRDQVHPPDQVHPAKPPVQVNPQTRYTPLEQCMLGDTGNKRAVRILLECILVLIIIIDPTRHYFPS